MSWTKQNVETLSSSGMSGMSGMAAMNGGLGASMGNSSAASSMDALTQAYSGMQQYTASALPSLYSQSLLQQAAAGSQKEGESRMHTHTPPPTQWGMNTGPLPINTLAFRSSV